MTLSESIKTQYSEVLKNDLLNESQEEEIFKMLFNMSEENKKIFTRVHGSSVVPSAAKPGPYDSIIAANETRAQKLAEQRQSVRL
jgi:hypothetical protein